MSSACFPFEKVQLCSFGPYIKGSGDFDVNVQLFNFDGYLEILYVRSLTRHLAPVKELCFNSEFYLVFYRHMKSESALGYIRELIYDKFCKTNRAHRQIYSAFSQLGLGESWWFNLQFPSETVQTNNRPIFLLFKVLRSYIIWQKISQGNPEDTWLFFFKHLSSFWSVV